MLTKTTFVAGIGFNREGEEIAEHDATTAIITIRTALALKYGGFTESQTLGGWDNGKETVTEAGRKWECLGNMGYTLPDAIHQARDMARFIARLLNQQAVTFDVVETHFEFVEQSEP